MLEEEVTKSTIEDLTPPNPIPTTLNKPISKSMPPSPKSTIKTKPTDKEYTSKTTKTFNTTPHSTIKEKRELEYRFAGRKTIAQLLKKSIPKQFTPTTRFATILGLLFLATVVLALITFPFSKLLSGDINVTIKIGYPLSYLELQIADPSTTPLKIKGLVIDLLLFFSLSYIIDVSINFLAETKIMKTKEELMQIPKTYSKLNPTTSDKITKKILE